MGKDAKGKQPAGKGKGKQPASGSDEGASKGGKGDKLSTCSFVKARHVLSEKQGKINEVYQKLQEGWLDNGDKVRPGEFGKILMAEGDTFGAAASDQLEIWAERIGCEIGVAKKEKAKALSVLTLAVRRGKEDGFDIVKHQSILRVATFVANHQQKVTCEYFRNHGQQIRLFHSQQMAVLHPGFSDGPVVLAKPGCCINAYCGISDTCQ